MKLCSLLVLFMLSIFPALQAQETQTQAAGEVMTLDEAIALALENNLGLKVEQLNPQIEDTFVVEETGRFEPLFQANLSNQDSDIPTGSRLSGEGTLRNKDLNYNLRLDQLLPTSTSYNVVFNNTRFETNQLFTSFNPRYDSSLFANVRQPLMRNFGREITLTPVNIAKTNRLASDSRLQTRALDIELAVTQAYLDYAFSNAELDVFKQSLAYARDLYENNKKQVEVGTMAPLEVVVAEAEVATREQAIIAGETAIQNNQDRLRTLIFGEKIGNWQRNIVLPGKPPEFKDVSITEEEAIQRALNNNPDIEALEMDLKSRNLSTKLARNATKPLLDLTGGLGWTGLGGPRLLFNDDIFNPVPIGVESGSYGDALSTMFENPTWTVGVILELPIGNKQAEAA
ncbi:MAG TPA: TolC family protein, partial [Acidobacteriota bacterium]|nr:TolC family protein [Acidobacteriota bacterium]